MQRSAINTVIWLFAPLLILLLTGGKGLQAQAPERNTAFEERSFSDKSLKDYRDNPDYQYFREKPEPIKREEREKEPRRYRPIKPPSGPRGDFSTAAKVFFWILIGGVVLFILYQIYKVGWKDIWKKKSDQAIVEVEREEDEVEDIRDLEFERLLQEAIHEKRYRHAVRLLYLNALKQMQEKALIQWKKDKTNHDYLRELKDPDLKPKFAHVTWMFEYVWYGEFPVDLNHFNLARTGFLEFEQAMRGGHAN